MKLSTIVITCCMLMLGACKQPPQVKEKLQPEITLHHKLNSVYYWKTVLQLDDGELEFIKRHDIGRIYLRMFDVVEDLSTSNPPDATYPNATLRIGNDQYRLLKDSLNTIEIVPVVYITLDALKAMHDHEDILAENIVTRVRNMAQYHELPNVKELQLDCDWTASTEDSFFKLCESVKNSISELNLRWLLSSTIRLHQLARKNPPVDSGVLMVYNTGSFNNPDTRNSIIDINDIKPYLKRLPDYPLNLDVAYPTYSWQLLFHNRKFIGLTNGVELNDTTKFTHKDKTQYVAKRDIPHNGIIIRAKDIVRSEISDYAEIAAVKKLIEQHLTEKPHSNIIYHLDYKNLSNYSDNEIQSILSTDR